MGARKEVDRQNPKMSKTRLAQTKPAKVWRIKDGTKYKEIQALHDGKISKNGDTESCWKGQCFSAQTVKPEWLMDSWIGTMVKYRNMEALREDMLRVGLGSVRLLTLMERSWRSYSRS